MTRTDPGPQQESKERQYRFLPDEPVTTKEDDEFKVHAAFAETLRTLISDSAKNLSDRGFVIGLSGAWGIGKSTVIEILRGTGCSSIKSALLGPTLARLPERMQEFLRLQRASFRALFRPAGTAGPPKCPILEFDISELSGNSLRRWLLIETDRQLGNLGVPGFSPFRHRGRTLEVVLDGTVQRSQINLNVLAIAVFATLVLCGGYLLLIRFHWFLAAAVWTRNSLKTTVGALSLLGILLVSLEKIVGSAFPTVTVSAGPTSSEDQFYAIFSQMVTQATRFFDGPLVLCLDNLDRADSHLAMQALRTVRAFTGHDHCICIIPCDWSRLVEASAAELLGSGVETDRNLARFRASDALGKYFNVILSMPPLDRGGLDEYAKTLAAQADLDDDTGVIQVAGAAYGAETPRQVKWFLNDLVAHLVLLERLQGADALPKDIPEQSATIAKVLAIRNRWPREFRLLAHNLSLAEQWSREAAKADSTNPGIDDGLWRFLRATRDVRLPVDPRILLYLKTSFPDEEYLRPTLREAINQGSYPLLRNAFEGYQFTAIPILGSLLTDLKASKQRGLGLTLLKHLLRLRVDVPYVDIHKSAEEAARWLVAGPDFVNQIGGLADEKEQLAELIAGSDPKVKPSLTLWITEGFRDLPIGMTEWRTLTDISIHPGVLSREECAMVGDRLAMNIRNGAKREAAVRASAHAVHAGGFWPGAESAVASAILDFPAATGAQLQDEVFVVCNIVARADDATKGKYTKWIVELIEGDDERSVSAIQSFRDCISRSNFTDDGLSLIASAVARKFENMRHDNRGLGNQTRWLILPLLPLINRGDLDVIDVAFGKFAAAEIDALADGQLIGPAKEYEFVRNYLPRSWERINGHLRTDP